MTTPALFRFRPVRTRKTTFQPGWFADELHGLLRGVGYSASNLIGGKNEEPATMDVVDASGEYLYTVTITRRTAA